MERMVGLLCDQHTSDLILDSRQQARRWVPALSDPIQQPLVTTTATRGRRCRGSSRSNCRVRSNGCQTTCRSPSSTTNSSTMLRDSTTTAAMVTSRQPPPGNNGIQHILQPNHTSPQLGHILDPLRTVLNIPILKRNLGHRLSKQSHPPLLVILAMMEDKELEGGRIKEGEEVDQWWTLFSVVMA